LARAHASGWLDDKAGQAAQRALKGLAKHLTPDGLLAGAAQSNKGGDALQKSDYRTIYQMGMGLKMQLMAAL
ncbi:MAG TPA: glucuronyl hydrolase, partial [Verrucomicrobiales bacterium]|nr:glucuronyl hydrolase [Verrucomicrobiales bacterium]